MQVGDPTYAADTSGFHMDNAVINTTDLTAAHRRSHRLSHPGVESRKSLFSRQRKPDGLTLDGTGNYTGGTFFDNQFSGFQTAINAIGHQVANPATTDWMNASTFVRVHIDCPTSEWQSRSAELTESTCSRAMETPSPAAMWKAAPQRCTWARTRRTTPSSACAMRTRPTRWSPMPAAPTTAG